MNTSSYQWFAIGISAFVIVEYIALFLIAMRRARFRDPRAYTHTEAVAFHARAIEGPVIAGLLILSLGVFASAITFTQSDYVKIAGLVFATARGVLLFLGVILLVAYWRQRRTWLGPQLSVDVHPVEPSDKKG